MAATVNRTDCGFRSAEYFISRFFSGLFKPKNPVLGCEFSGIVSQIGSNVHRFKVGDKVFAFNDITFGGYAEFVVMHQNSAICLIPEGFNIIEAAALSEGSHYALCNIRAAKITAGQHVLVNGATGAIGSAAVQILIHMKVHVTVVCASPHVKRFEDLGVHHIIDYLKADFTQINQQFDVVFDAVGKSSFGKCKRILKPKGIYMSTELGKGGQNPFLALLSPLWGGKKVLFPLPTISNEDLEYLKNLAEIGAFKPFIDRTYSLEQIVEATYYVETGQKIGNVILHISNDEAGIQ
jgi:NADPH:quinone reductase-like Zn-dependent oxidoreductase